MEHRTFPLTGELLKLKNEIRGYAVDYGLDFFEVVFEICDYDTINIVAAQGGFPSRYPHWRFGMEYEQLSRSYTYGLQKIYELVINTDPSYAYLLKANHIVDQKIVFAHVYGHSDFFKNNYWFKHTNRKMIDVMANHGTKIRRYMDIHGQDNVENFIDRVLSLENLINVGDLFETPDIERRRKELDKQALAEEKDELLDGRSQALKSFMSTKKRNEKNLDKDSDKKDEEARKKKEELNLRFPEQPERDIMRFLAEHAPIAEWQSDVIGILREEAYYFLPQRLTKIMNEGWASLWHSTIMTQRAMRSSEIIDFADHHAGVMQMSRTQLNPYKLGIELFRDIEQRWNTGRFGKEYNECEDMVAKAHWDNKMMKGREKVFEVRSSHNDITFIDEFLTQEFCNDHQFFTYKYNPRTGRFEIDTRDFLAIKQKLLSQLTNYGSPIIEVEDANFQNRGELLLAHKHYGVDLDMQFASDTLRNIFSIWKRPCNLKTRVEDKEIVFTYNGKEMRPLA